MKAITCMVLWLITVSTSYSQSDTITSIKKSRFTIGISAGVCFPIGEFSTFQQHFIGLSPSNYAGEAKTGFGAGIDLNYGIGNHFGIAGSLYGSIFKAEPKTIRDFNGNFSGFSAAQYPEVEPGSWVTTGLLAGGQFDFSLGKVQVALQALGGIQKSSSPEVRYKSYSTNPDIIQSWIQETDIQQPSLSSIDPAFRCGLNISYPVRKNKLLTLKTAYTTASSTFEGEDMVIDNNVNNGGSTYTNTYYRPISFKKQISFLSVSVGFAVKL